MAKRYQLWIWNKQTGYGGTQESESDELGAIKSEFDCRILKANCDFAAVYDDRDRKRALWTFPSYWDGHDHAHGRGFEPNLWRSES